MQTGLMNLVLIEIDVFVLFSYEENTIPNILSTLVSRARIPEIQIAASRCLTYIHRSGSLCSTDIRIVYRTLPCLARLCSEEFDEDIRATAAETLAYLAEVDLQAVYQFANFINAFVRKYFRSTRNYNGWLQLVTI